MADLPFFIRLFNEDVEVENFPNFSSTEIIVFPYPANQNVPHSAENGFDHLYSADRKDQRFLTIGMPLPS